MNFVLKKLCKLCVFWRVYLWVLIFVFVSLFFTPFVHKLPLLHFLPGGDVLAYQHILMAVAIPILTILLLLSSIWLNTIKLFSRTYRLQALTKRDITEVLYLFTTLEEKIGLCNIARHRPRRPILVFALWFKKITANHLARWMGLGETNIRFSISHMNEGVGGRTCLRGNVIEINNSIIKHPESYLSTLCHELAHVLLQRIRIHADLDNDEELFTDMTCVFLGLGDVMLNGCVSTTEEKEYIGCDMYKITKEVINVGYLSPLQLAISELIVRNMYKGFKRVSKTYDFSARYLLNKVRCQLIDMDISIRRPRGLSCLDYLNLLQSRLRK